MLTIRAAAPVDDFGLVDLEAMIVLGVETRRRSNGTVDIEDEATASTYQVMVIVPDAIFETGGRSSGLDATNEAFVGKGSEGVVARLPRDGANPGSHHLGQLFRCAVRGGRDRFHHCQAMSGDLQSRASKLLLEALITRLLLEGGLSAGRLILCSSHEPIVNHTFWT